LSQEFYRIQNDLYNFAEFKKDQAEKTFPVEYGMSEHDDITALRDTRRSSARTTQRLLRKLSAWSMGTTLMFGAVADLLFG
jgi:hypothetical protein